jgi:hypothetical protein
MKAAVLVANGSWCVAEFQVDIGADRTVLHAPFLNTRGLQQMPAPHQLGGVGGATTTILVATEIRFELVDGGSVTFDGSFAGFVQPEALDMNVLGRDITNLFAVIIDKPDDVVCMLAKPHGYIVTQ